MAADETLIDELVTSADVTQLPALVKGQNAFMGPVRKPQEGPGSAAVPRHRSVFALLQGGTPPMEYIGQGLSTLRFSRVQVRIRGEPRKFEEGQELARQCFVALQGKDLAGFISTLVRESEPVFIGFDETEHPEWTFNVDMISGGV